MSNNLPEIDPNTLSVWDENRNKCAGYLSKKASQASAFSKGKWQKRWFVVDLDATQNDNYSLQYFHGPDERTPRQVFPLAGATIKIASNTNFVITLADGNIVSLNADNEHSLKRWTGTLETVISTANLRERVFEQYENEQGKGNHFDLGAIDNHSLNHNNMLNSDNNSTTNKQRRRGDGGAANAHHAVGGKMHRINSAQGKSWPTIRIDLDAASIPPGSTERHRFNEMFQQDIAAALDIEPDVIEVISIKSAPGMEWLSLVEFDINLSSLEFEDSVAANEDQSVNQAEMLQTARSELRKKLLQLLYEMVHDTSSQLYLGILTSKLDPNFSLNLARDSTQHATNTPTNNYLNNTQTSIASSLNNSGIHHNQEEVPLYSADANVLRIMHKYKDVVLPDDFVDPTTFSISICFEDRLATIEVPNPQVLAQRSCVLWPHEVKAALGFVGTMQELWIEPIALVPQDGGRATVSSSKVISFAPSARLGGQKVINAVHLKADMTYDVKWDDRREDALKSLSKEEMAAIKETFQKCDINGDGGISKNELEEVIRSRTIERKNIIEEKFLKFISENELTEEEVEIAEFTKTQYLQQLTEAQTKLIKMFEAADVNGDGVISFTEFILAEAWWLRCAINPDRAHLF